MTEIEQAGWSKVAKYLYSINYSKNPITVHPSPGDGSYSSRHIFTDKSLFDIDMLQTGHLGQNSFEITLKTLFESISSTPLKPVINSEVCYEGIMGSSWQETQRFLFWVHMLSGAAGHTYGAIGLYDCYDRKIENRIELEWGDYSWQEGYKFPGAYQLGIGKKFLEQFEWYKFEPHSEWVEPHKDETNKFLPYAAGIPEKVRIIYIPAMYLSDFKAIKKIELLNIENEINYVAYFFNPRNGKKTKKFEVKPDKKGKFIISNGHSISHPTMEDWVLVLVNIQIQ